MRLRLELNDEEANALMQEAGSNFRHPQQQALVILRKHLGLPIPQPQEEERSDQVTVHA